MTLRPYQVDAWQAIRDNYQRYRRQLLYLATRAGKTIIMAEILKTLQGKALVIAHTDELIDQAYNKIRAINPMVKIGIEKGTLKADKDCSIVIASIQTLKAKRLEKFSRDEFSIIIIDEAHHCTVKNMYGKLLNYFMPMLVLGFTATPFRTDRKKLVGPDAPFEALTYEAPIRKLTMEGWLCRIMGVQVRTDVDLTGLKSTMGDFERSMLQQHVNTVDRNKVVIDAYDKYTPNEKAIVFCAGVTHAQEVAKCFPCAEAIYGDMNKDNRKDIIRDFRDGSVPVLTNFNVLTEGFDVLDISSIIMARPTKSPVLYVQSIGRGNGVAEGKHHLTVIDIVDNTKRFDLMTVCKVFNENAPHFDCEGGDVLRLVQKYEEIPEPIDPGRPVTFDAYKLLLNETIIDLLGLDSEFGEYVYAGMFPDAPATPPQLAQLKKFKIYTHNEKITRKQAFFLIDQEILARKAKGDLPATRGQISRLEIWGIDYPDGITFEQARKIIAHGKIRERKGA